MRLFGYYAIHSTWNQIRKLFKTSFIIFIVVCLVMGMGIGFGVAMLSDESEEDEIQTEEPGTEISEDDVIEEILGEETEDIILDDNGLSIKQADGSYVILSIPELMEAATALVLLVLLFYFMFAANKSGGKIFLMADVNLLFASPMKPQSVLLFRLLCQLGTMVFASAYLIFQVPNLVINLEVPLRVAVMLLVAWFSGIAIAYLVQVMVYTISSTHDRLKKYLQPTLMGIVFLLFAAVLSYAKASGQGYIAGAVHFINAPGSRFVPFVGWIKGLLLYCYEDNIPMMLLMLALLIIGMIGLIYIIWNLKADFYEDAMGKSEEVANFQRDAQEGRTIIATKKKDRSDKMKRDGMNRGWGSSVFFYKSIYNRMRFARFGFLTKTTITYVILICGICFIQSRFFEEMNFLPMVLAIGVFVFYRSLGNPLGEDTQMAYFVLIPENTWAKLFWSLLAGSVNCLLDILPAIIIAAFATRTGPATVIAWIIIILTVDFYATTVSTFLGVAIPQNVGSIVKQLIMVLFIYFGLLPDIILIALGMVLDHMVLASAATALINIFLGLLFFLLTPAWMDPRGGRRLAVAPVSEEKRLEAKKDFAWLGFSCFVIVALTNGLQYLLASVVRGHAPQNLENSYGFWFVAFLPMYLMAIPVGIALMRKVKAEKPESRSLKPFELLQIFVICEFLMYAGNLIGIGINAVLNHFLPVSAVNPLEEFAGADNLWMKILFMVILAPCIEEFLFRKQLIDRMRPYGEKLAIITTALMFGLFHGNFSQFFYATFLGLVFGYIYTSSGKLRYSIGLHMLINFMGSVLSVELLDWMTRGLEELNKTLELATVEELAEMSFSQIPIGVIVFFLYILLLLAMGVVGFVVLVIRLQNISFQATDKELGKGQALKTAWLNWGMFLMFLSCLAMFVLAMV